MKIAGAIKGGNKKSGKEHIMRAGRQKRSSHIKHKLVNCPKIACMGSNAAKLCTNPHSYNLHSNDDPMASQDTEHVRLRYFDQHRFFTVGVA